MWFDSTSARARHQEVLAAVCKAVRSGGGTLGALYPPIHLKRARFAARPSSDGDRQPHGGVPHARHTFGTHAALFGVNPWRLQKWLGHKRIDKTMIYVHVAEAHQLELPEVVREAGRGIDRARSGAVARGSDLRKMISGDEPGSGR